VRGLFNATGNVTHQYSYGPFGEVQSASGSPANPLRFAARELDATTGLYYFRARWYDPSMSRFISEDPIGLAGGTNDYAYALNDPVNLSDPTGLCPCLDPVIVRARAGRWTDGFYTSAIDQPFSILGARDDPYYGPHLLMRERVPEWCVGGFDAYQCGWIREALDRLQEHEIPFCRVVGSMAQRRFLTGNYIYDRSSPHLGQADVYGGGKVVWLGPLAFNRTVSGRNILELQNTIAHEEGHYVVGGGHAFDGTFTGTPSPLGSADQIGEACKDKDGLVRVPVR
jgi:RHS repeat-associated protein